MKRDDLGLKINSFFEQIIAVEDLENYFPASLASTFHTKLHIFSEDLFLFSELFRKFGTNIDSKLIELSEDIYCNLFQSNDTIKFNYFSVDIQSS